MTNNALNSLEDKYECRKQVMEEFPIKFHVKPDTFESFRFDIDLSTGFEEFTHKGHMAFTDWIQALSTADFEGNEAFFQASPTFKRWLMFSKELKNSTVWIEYSNMEYCISSTLSIHIERFEVLPAMKEIRLIAEVLMRDLMTLFKNLYELLPEDENDDD